ncbi:MAG: AAA family ATPase [Clostridia bacterium]|nr:AAA family ATPase [Clostridia bacterium]
MRYKFAAIEAELNQAYLERREVVRGLLVGLLARQHVLLLGPPGTAKSALAEDICSRIGGIYFRWLLARTSTPEELFGPVSLKALEQDSYRRVTAGKLPEATIAFLDEIWKCNSAVLNSLLSVLNERLFFNDGQPAPVPLQMAVGASNELPEDREELGALWDRFGLRYVVGYIKNPAAFEAMLKGSNGGARTSLTPEELAQAQAEAAAVKVEKVIPFILTLRQKMAEENIAVSDRRWKMALDLVRANAWLNGWNEADANDLDVLAAALWQDPEQIPLVRRIIASVANPLDQEAVDLLDQAMEVWQEAVQAPEDKATALGAEANAKLKKITKQLEGLRAEAREKGRDATRIEETLAQVIAWNREVVAKCLGIQI